MGLSEFILSHREEILSEWVAFARSCTPSADTMTLVLLSDHASEMLEAIAADLNTDQSKSEQADKSKGKRDAPRKAGTQALSNVISNAVQYGSHETPINVTIHGEADEVALAVQNRVARIDDRVKSIPPVRREVHTSTVCVAAVERDELASRHIAQVWPGGQVDGRRELRQYMLRQVEVEIEALKVTSGLPLGFVNELLWKNHATRFVMRVRQRVKPSRPDSPVLDIVR